MATTILDILSSASDDPSRRMEAEDFVRNAKQAEMFRSQPSGPLCPAARAR